MGFFVIVASLTIINVKASIMSEYPDIQTQQVHRATLRKTYRNHPDNERIRKALLKSVRPIFIQQAAKHGVFICYAMADGVFALDLALALREAGIRAFMDELDMDASMAWGETVNQALRDCAVLLMVLSPNALDDAEVIGEYTYFMNSGKIIIPIIAEACDTNQLPTMIPAIHLADDTNALQHLKSLLIHHD